jgi:hypothetical protein
MAIPYLDHGMRTRYGILELWADNDCDVAALAITDVAAAADGAITDVAASAIAVGSGSMSNGFGGQLAAESMRNGFGRQLAVSVAVAAADDGLAAAAPRGGGCRGARGRFHEEAAPIAAAAGGGGCGGGRGRWHEEAARAATLEEAAGAAPPLRPRTKTMARAITARLRDAPY